jgi:uncharacterized protein involved in exopolysaccharide biosynthesis
MAEGKDDTRALLAPAPATGDPDGPAMPELSVLDVAIVVARYKWHLLGIPFVAALLALGVTFFIPNSYVGRAVLMPPQQQQSSVAAMLGQLNAIPGVSGANLGLKNPNDLYVGILGSRTIADALIARFGLAALYDQSTQVDARAILDEHSDFLSGKDGLIVVEVVDRDPKRAADMANAYVEELEKLMSTLAITEAGQRRLFFEKQLTQAKDDLARAETSLKATQEKTGLVQIDEQGKAMIEAVATLRAQIVAREVEMASLQSYATESNPEMVKAQQELAGLRAQLRKLERGGGNAGDVFMPTGKIPSAGLEYVRKFREVKYAETIFELMAKQYELAKVDESRDSASVQVVDRAVASDKKSGPRRGLICLVVAVVTGLLVFAWVLAVERAALLRGHTREKMRHLGSLVRAPWPTGRRGPGA